MTLDLDELLKDDKLPRIESEAKDSVPFPQANSLDVVLDVVMNTEVEGCSLSILEVQNVVNSPRQAAYYMNAAIYLGLCQKISNSYYPTKVGLELQKLPRERRKSKLAACIIAHPVIGRWYTQIFQYETKDERLNFILTGFESKLAFSTKCRRAECVLSWLEWVQKHLPEL